MGNNIGIPFAIWVGAGTCVISLFFAFFLAFMDRQSEQIVPPPVKTGDGDTIHFKDVLKFRYTTWYLIAVCVLFYVSIFVFLQFGR